MPPYNAEATLSAGADSEEINSPDIANSTRFFKVNGSPNNKFAANTEPAAHAARVPLADCYSAALDVPSPRQ